MQKYEAESNFESLILQAIQTGATKASVVSTKEISVEDRLANLCREPRCENYGHSASCPPYVAGPAAFRELLNHYDRAIVVRIDVPTDILFSDERRDIMRLLHEIVAGIERSSVKMGYPNSKAFAGGSCKQLFCHDHAECRVVSEKGDCRNPEYARPSMSGFGINVRLLMESAGWSKDSDSEKTSMSGVSGIVLIG